MNNCKPFKRGFPFLRNNQLNHKLINYNFLQIKVLKQNPSKNPRLTGFFEFIWCRANAELRSDLTRGFLGFIWWIAEPIFYMLVFYIVFGLVFAQKGENYVPFLLSGLIFWKWFDSSIRQSSMAIQHNMNLIYQVYLPKFVFPIVSITTSTLRFGLVFVIFLGFLLLLGVEPSLNWLIYLPILLILQLLLMLGMGMTLSAIVPFIPDIKFLIDNGMLLLFFLSGIFFRFENIPSKLQPFFKLNPIGMLITEYRHLLLNGNPPVWGNLIPTLAIALLFLLLGVYLLHKYDRAYAKRAFL